MVGDSCEAHPRGAGALAAGMGWWCNFGARGVWQQCQAPRLHQSSTTRPIFDHILIQADFDALLRFNVKCLHSRELWGAITKPYTCSKWRICSFKSLYLNQNVVSKRRQRTCEFYLTECIDLIWQPTADRVSFWRQSNANIWGPFHLAQHQCCETPHHKFGKKYCPMLLFWLLVLLTAWMREESIFNKEEGG